ncbi:MAG: aldo/keto reductase [Treponema sp.]|nr:aldo/keto reductase [Treponema sp.]
MKDDQIDVEEFNKIIDLAMAEGVNYFDTSHLYHQGNSERALGLSLVKRHPRESFILATKIGAWGCKSPADMERIFKEQLQRLGVEYFDMYLLQSLEESHMHLYNDMDYDFWGFGRRLKEKGLIKHFGFSFHDTPERLDEHLTKHPEAEFVQLQLNYLDWENPIVQSRGCYEVARRHKKPIIVMGPIKGGILASMEPHMEAKLKAQRPDDSIASWALRFVLGLPGVATILSGMSTAEQLEDNAATVKYYQPFSEKEEFYLGEVTTELLASPTVACTACNYCVADCPAKINIPQIITGYNTVLLYGDHARAHFFYRGLMLKSAPASACTSCGTCEKICPQHVKVMEVMGKASEVFDAKDKPPPTTPRTGP